MYLPPSPAIKKKKKIENKACGPGFLTDCYYHDLYPSTPCACIKNILWNTGALFSTSLLFDWGCDCYPEVRRKAWCYTAMLYDIGDFGRLLSYDIRALVNVISALMKEPSENYLPYNLRWYRENTAIYESESGLSPDLNLLVLWFWISQPPELWEVKHLSFNPLSL